REVFDEIFKTGKPPSEIVESQGLAQIGDEEAITAAVREAIEKNPDAVAKYRAGNEKVLSFLMGQVMKQTRGRADAQLVQMVLKRLLAGK
nr:Asp-tRNA(Asn)/Glu-tRNA(Gln) amidotransferase GatCAB subunit B [Armatimonadota bacterium]NIM24483.1 Asp-tRNA(Asn)/Glu-tRNA(Gln) amidotransferase GatCAB subunit B [Armatimonadota bacterium]NIM68354.1 Asp-tRNA(Asn)/Glu-tRNA(Gln) amidotransferase GatCAB subunit B [Armatimonadota bacterium]NIM76758.1 Asp-tRNA(Asn)/Glu-tRNA(Gln) amidotransferase GatCAB subunit B [Armatimonadota bacterium]NIN06557.1 Asp-tRNA(Asn)/Glu-tRNA(Gln) amidotransferase GatCAB subunit B [Armatimonadota bacterium]